jgi:hypothetical protein
MSKQSKESMSNQTSQQIAFNTLIEELKRELLPILAVPKRYLNEQEASRYLGGLSVYSLRQWRSKGTGPNYLRVGTRIVYDMKVLDVWIEQFSVRK